MVVLLISIFSLIFLLMALAQIIRLYKLGRGQLGWLIWGMGIGSISILQAVTIIQSFLSPQTSKTEFQSEITVLIVSLLFVSGTTFVFSLLKTAVYRNAADVVNEERMELLDMSGIEGILVHEKGVIVDANQNLCTLFGAGRQEIIGRSIYDFVPPDCQHAVKHHISSGSTAGLETKAQKKDGSVFPVETNAKQILYLGRNVRSVSLRDISARKLAEEKLLKSLATNRALLDAIPDIIFRVRTDGTFLDYKASNSNLLMVPPGYFLGRRVGDIMPPHIAESIMQFISKALSTGMVQIFEYDLHVNEEDHSFEARIASCGANEVLILARDITESSKALAALQKSETRYRAIVEDQTEMICRFQPDGTITFANDSYCRYFGIDRHLLMGSNVKEVIPSEDRESTFARLRSLNPINPVVMIEHKVFLKNGAIGWNRWTDRAIFSDSGELREYQAIGIEITERKRVEEALRENETRLRMLTNQIPAILWSIDNNLRFTSSVGSGLKRLGLKPNEIIGVTLHKFFGPSETDNIAIHMHRQALDGTPVSYPHEWGGSSYQCYLEPLFGSDNEIVGCIGVAVDVTDQQNAQLALTRSEERYRLFIQQSSEGIWRIELDSPINISDSLENQIEQFYKLARLAECNDAFAQMYEFASASEIIGIPLDKLLIRTDPKNIEFLFAFIQSGYRLTDVETHEQNKNGDDIYILNNLIGVVENGLLVRAWGTQQNITELKRSQHIALAEKQSKLESDLQIKTLV